MKKYCLISGFLIFSLLLSACVPAAPVIESTVGTTQAQTQPVDTEVLAPAQPLVAVSVPAVTETTTADDGTVLFTYTYQDIALTLSGQAVADHVILDFLNRIDSTVSTAETILSAAEANYSGNANWIPYLCQVLYQPTRIDQGVLSFFGSTVTYSGASHPEQNCMAANYNLLSGDVLTLGSILSHIDSVDTLRQLLISQLEEMKEEKYLYPDFAETVKQRFAGEESYDEDWYFTETGLCFYFSPYEIAPYSSGIITAEIPYEKLVGVIADDFFPAEAQPVSGEIKFSVLDESNIDAFEDITELVLDNEGDMYVITTDSAVQHLQVLVSNPDTAESYVAFSANALQQGDALMIQANNDQLANTHIRYFSNDTYRTQNWE